jgi:hypothetical protein
VVVAHLPLALLAQVMLAEAVEAEQLILFQGHQ